MRHRTNRAKRILSMCVAAVMLVLSTATPIMVHAMSADDSKTAEQLVEMLLSGGIEVSNCTMSGDVRAFSGGSDFGGTNLGIDSGVMLSTHWSEEGNEQTQKDEDLASLIGTNYSYSGDTATLQFTMTATGTLLNFNYVFMSSEFNTGPNFNDCFGLFVKVNDGAYENIALLSNGQPVTMTNLRAGISGTENSNGSPMSSGSGSYDYFEYNSSGVGNMSDTGFSRNMNGYSHVFSAQKAVSVGDTVTIKFVIADVGDTAYESAVLLEGGSLSFDAPGAKPDYQGETITGLDPGTYEIKTVPDEGVTYKFILDEGEDIPLVGTDDNGNDYNFLDKKLSIVQKIGDDTSDPVEVDIPQRPEAPASVNTADVTTSLSENKITLETSVPEQEYILVPKGTSVTEEIWNQASSNANGAAITFTTDSLGNTIDTDLKYVIYTRVAAGSGLKSPSSEASGELGFYTPQVPTSDPTPDSGQGSDSNNSDPTPSQPVTPTATPSTPNNITNDTNTTQNAQGALLDESGIELAESVLTQAEQARAASGENVKIWLEATEIQATEVQATDEDQILITTVMNTSLPGYSVGMYLDFTLWKQFNNEEPVQIHTTTEAVTIKFRVPEPLINADASVVRTYQIIRVHEGVTDVLPCSYDPVSQTISFETDRFSCYALVYTDTVVVPGESVNQGSDQLDDVPKTGDTGSTPIWFALMLFSGLGVVFVQKKAIRRR